MISHKDILLVGSIPLENSEAVFRLLASRLGRDAKRYPDGETAERKNWIRWQRHVFDSSKEMELLDPEHSLASYTDGLYRPVYRVKEGIVPGQIHFANLGFADAAVDSYAVFKRLKAENVIPKETRFQVSIPTIVALLTSFVVKQDRAAVEPALEDAMRREIKKMAGKIPAKELAVQWDVCMEIVGYDGGFDLHYTDILTQSIESICRQVNFIPEGAEAGIHLCYGDPGHKHLLEPKDTETSVVFANAIGKKAGRPIDWIHLPVPRNRSDDGYFSPLSGLHVPGQTEIYLGLVHATDGVPGARQRIAAAERYLRAFGVATECGFGRRPPESVPDLLDLHRAAGAAA